MREATRPRGARRLDSEDFAVAVVGCPCRSKSPKEKQKRATGLQAPRRAPRACGRRRGKAQRSSRLPDSARQICSQEGPYNLIGIAFLATAPTTDLLPRRGQTTTIARLLTTSLHAHDGPMPSVPRDCRIPQDQSASTTGPYRENCQICSHHRPILIMRRCVPYGCRTPREKSAYATTIAGCLTMRLLRRRAQNN